MRALRLALLAVGRAQCCSRPLLLASPHVLLQASCNTYAMVEHESLQYILAALLPAGSSICFISFGYGSTASMYINRPPKKTVCIGYFREPAGTSMAGKAILAACQALNSADAPCCTPAECLPAPALDLWCCALAEGLLLTEGRPFMWPSSGHPPLTEDGEWPLPFWLSCTSAWGRGFLLRSRPLRAAGSAHWPERLS